MGQGHACDSGPFASAAAILSDGIAVVSRGTLTPLLRRKTLIGSGSEECPTCAPNQRRSTQPPVTVTGRVTSEPGCSRGDHNSPDEQRNLMQTTTLARYGAPIAIVVGALMIITRLVILFTTPAEIGPLKAYVLTT